MNKEEIIQKLKDKGLDEIIKLISDAEKGKLEELELVENLGLLFDEQLNREVLDLLQSLGVSIIYVNDDEENNDNDDDE